MDHDNDEFLQKHFPDADKANMFRSSDRIVGWYQKYDFLTIYYKI